MTLANLITLARICLIPIFAFVASSYSATYYSGNPDGRLRLASVILFLLAAVTDAVDGFVARHLNQRSRLGAILDPLADKGLVFTALVLLANGIWSQGFSAWFPALVIGRDLILIIGFLILSALSQPLVVRPSPSGKLATVLQLVSILWALSGFNLVNVLFVVIPAAVLTLYSGVGYVMDGIRQTRSFRREKKMRK
jgi:CDP-diacylglycerol--glycerol-3-phosphate 3-phosphatidyltransferase